MRVLMSTGSGAECFAEVGAFSSCESHEVVLVC